jgi:hypothetical protein
MADGGLTRLRLTELWRAAPPKRDGRSQAEAAVDTGGDGSGRPSGSGQKNRRRASSLQTGEEKRRG